MATGVFKFCQKTKKWQKWRYKVIWRDMSVKKLGSCWLSPSFKRYLRAFMLDIMCLHMQQCTYTHINVQPHTEKHMRE